MQAVGRPPRAPDDAPLHYERHRPERTTLLVQRHAVSFIEAHGRTLLGLLEQLCSYITRPALHGVLAHNAKLRVFDIDMQSCLNSGGGQIMILSAILERPVIEKILTHLGLDS